MVEVERVYKNPLGGYMFVMLGFVHDDGTTESVAKLIVATDEQDRRSRWN